MGKIASVSRRLGIIVFISLATVPASDMASKESAPSPRRIISANKGWKFHAGPLNGAEMATVDETGWISVNVPHDFQISQPWIEPGPDEVPDSDNPVANVRSRLSSRAFKEMGQGWYRLQFTPSSEWKGKRVLIDFEGILLVGDVYLNGEYIGGTDYGYLGFESDITDKIKYGEPNVITVKADTGAPENSRWYTGAGLYRDVNFVITDPDQYFVRHPFSITTPKAEADESLVVVTGEIMNRVKGDSLKVGIEIVASDGTPVYSAVKSHWLNRKQLQREFILDSISISNPRLWDLERPDLYTMTATIYRPDGTVADSQSERFGIRKIEFSPEFGFRLNGRKVLLKGIANHHTLGATGAAAYPRAMEKRLDLLKEFGFNHVRTSHNPYSKSFLDLCDEKGILVVDELYDKWMKQYAGGRTEWENQWQHTVPEWVRRDRNHPSVIFWSLGNELQLLPDMPHNDWGVTPYNLQKTLLKRYDKTRPVTVAMHPRGRNELTDSLPAPLVLETDIAAYNYRYMYFPGDSRRFPWMMFYQSEANTSNMGPNYFDMDLDKVIGMAYWGMIDYFGESQGWPAKGWQNGVFDISLEPKPEAYFLRSYFLPDKPLVRIAVVNDEKSTEWNGIKTTTRSQSSHWTHPEGSRLDLYTYTNGDEVELLVNGKSLGRRANNVAESKERNRILWKEIPYAKGSIEARAYRKGEDRPIAVHRLVTAGKGVKLAASADNANWKADGRDLQHIRIEALDAKGIRDPHAAAKVDFEVEGPAEIVGVINGDLTSEELTTGNSRSLYEGTCVVILRSTENAGTVTLKAKAPGMKEAKVELKVHEPAYKN